MAPDEPGRLLVVKFIHSTGQLPIGNEEAVRLAEWGNSYAFSVYGSSLLAQLILFPAQIICGSLDDNAVALAARFVNVLLATGTVSLCFPIGKRLFTLPMTTVLLALLVGLLPQFVFLASYFNCDIMGVFSTALIILCLLRGLESNWTKKNCVFLGIALGICSLSYYFAYGAILVSILVYYGSYLKRSKRQPASLDDLLVKPSIILASALAISGWFFVRAFILYDGDIFGRSASVAAGEMYADDWLKPSKHLTPKLSGMSVLDMLFSDKPFNNLPWISTSVKSYIAVFGYMSIYLANPIYYVYCALIGLGITFGFSSTIREKDLRLRIAWMTALVVIPLALSVYYSWSSDYQPQGRYLMSSLPAIMIFTAKGWESIGLLLNRRFGGNSATASDRISPLASLPVVLIAATYAALFAYVVCTLIVPYCVGPAFAIL